MVQLSHLYMTTGKTIALTTLTFVGKIMSLFFNMLSEEALQIAVKTREMKSKGEKERYKYLNAEFQRIGLLH